jgi:preprotein translocase subunit SecG
MKKTNLILKLTAILASTFVVLYLRLNLHHLESDQTVRPESKIILNDSYSDYYMPSISLDHVFNN